MRKVNQIGIDQRALPPTLLDVIRKAQPEFFARWDGWDYRIWSPSSLDDIPTVRVWLIRQNGDYEEYVMGL